MKKLLTITLVVIALSGCVSRQPMVEITADPGVEWTASYTVYTTSPSGGVYRALQEPIEGTGSHRFEFDHDQLQYVSVGAWSEGDLTIRMYEIRGDKTILKDESRPRDGYARSVFWHHTLADTGDNW